MGHTASIIVYPVIPGTCVLAIHDDSTAAYAQNRSSLFQLVEPMRGLEVHRNVLDEKNRNKEDEKGDTAVPTASTRYQGSNLYLYSSLLLLLGLRLRAL